ncbi:hypothetical protein [Streptomyces nanshensis]|uniref:hypothetical protein n=1 Tax=Streptomyces nanshensis TaxID=518642 RepID=UPI00085CCB7D|nr:hypothetical protein [Streptomyces nanshensis]
MSENARRRTAPHDWRGRVAVPWMLVSGGVLAVVCLVLVSLYTDRPPTYLGVFVVALTLLVFGAVDVVVTRHGVTVRSVLVPVLRRRIPLTSITEAFAKRARPMELGGWGYRWLPRRTSVSLRAGDALWLRLAGGREFVVTVDDAARAARTVNGNLGRADGG